MAQRKIAIVVGYGQSNENGTSVRIGQSALNLLGSTLTIRNTVLMGDTTLKTSGASGMFDYFADAVARNGAHVRLENRAIGGTGLVPDWNGRLINWAASTSYAGAIWVLPPTPNGFKYLAQNTTAGVTGSTAPTWPTSAGATVTDGTVTWRAFATTAKDVAGYVYAPGDDGYDPWTVLATAGVSGANSRLAAVYASIAKYKALGYEVWNIIQGGQNDVSPLPTVSTADLTKALTSHVTQSLAAGADYVLLGLTPPYLLSANIADWGSAARPAPGQGGRVAASTGGRLVDARNAVLASFAGNSKVKAGADLSVLNDNTITVTETGGNAALTNIHLQHIGQQVAAKLWYDQVRTLGIV